MAITYLSGNRLSGLSTDTKPTTAQNGAVFYETDNMVTFDFDGSSWTARSSVVVNDNVTIEGKTQTLADWLIMQKETPSVATNIVATVDGDTTVTVSYDNLSTDKITYMRVQYSTDNVTYTTATTTGGSSSYQVTGLTEDTDYYFRVYPSNIMGEQPTPTTTSVAVGTWLTPTQVLGMTATNAKPNVTIAYSAVTAIPTATYSIERSLTGSGSWSVVGTSATTTFSDLAVTQDVDLYYRVRATNSVGFGAYSATATVHVYSQILTQVGATVSTLGAYTYYKWETSGTLDITGYDMEILVVGAGGSGRNGGGGCYGTGAGGAGGVVVTDAYEPLLLGVQNVTVGVAHATNGSGTASSYQGLSGNGGSVGGCGNGGASGAGSLGVGVTGTAYPARGGGAGTTYGGAGGGGSVAGGTGASAWNGGAGGAGIAISQFTQFGDSGAFGGGGGGGGWVPESSYHGGAGGLGGGGNGTSGYPAQSLRNAVNYTGGGGGGLTSGAGAGLGGHGVIIMRRLT